MDSTPKGNEPRSGSEWQPSLFDQGGDQPDGRDQLRSDVSADPNRLPPRAVGQHMPGEPNHAGGPVLVRERSAQVDPVWAQRLKLIVFVLFCIELGMLLAVLPWTHVWTENSLLFGHPALHNFLEHNFVRGAITGLGLIDIWLGIREAVVYNEKRD